MKESIGAGPEPVSGSYHYMSSAEAQRKGAKEQEPGDEMKVDDVIRNVVQPEYYPAQSGQGRSAVSGIDEYMEIFPVIFTR